MKSKIIEDRTEKRMTEVVDFCRGLILDMVEQQHGGRYGNSI